MRVEGEGRGGGQKVLKEVEKEGHEVVKQWIRKLRGGVEEVGGGEDRGYTK